MRHLGSLGPSSMLSTSPDVRSDELVLAAAVQRYVRRETEPVTHAIEHWGKRIDGRLNVLDEVRRDDAIHTANGLAALMESMTRLHQENEDLGAEILALQHNVSDLRVEIDALRYESLTSRWRRLMARIRGWWR